MGLGKPRGDDLSEVRRRSKKLTTARKILCVAALLPAIALAVVIIYAGALVGFSVTWLLLCSALIVAVVVGWLWWTVFPRRRDHEPAGMGVNVLDEPKLYAWVAELAHDIGVAPPGGIRITPSTGVWVADLEDSASLVIGLGTLAWLKEDEFERLAALELSMLRVRREEGAMKALRLARDLDVTRLTHSTLPVVGGLVQRAGRLLDRRRDDLYAACTSWAVNAVPLDLRVRPGDTAEAKVVEEAWDVLVDRWVSPATEAGVALDHLAQANNTLLRAFEDGKLLERDWQRPVGPAASALLKDARATDHAVSDWQARLHPELSADLVPWDEYLERVTMSTWRATVKEAVAAAGQAMGVEAPATLETLLRAVESGWSDVIGLILVEDDGADAKETAADASLRPPIHSSRSEDAVVRALSHTASLALVEQMVGAAELDLLWGVRVETFDGKPIETEANVRAFCRSEDWSGLRAWVDHVGIDPTTPLRLGPGRSRAMAVPARAIL